nr:hypothetical protein [Tanacetum cinerariifolium]
MAEDTIRSLRIGQANCVLEARVYRKWVSNSILQKKEIAFCCILTDKELSSRVPYRDENSKIVYPMLTDYMGYIRSISDITPFGDANKGQGWLRKVDIENLDGNVVEFAMWDDLAKQFNKEEIEKLLRPIIIVVSSCKVSKYRGSGQLTVVDILDFQPALETEYTGITLDATTTEVIEESTSKRKDKLAPFQPPKPAVLPRFAYPSFVFLLKTLPSLKAHVIHPNYQALQETDP